MNTTTRTPAAPARARGEADGEGAVGAGMVLFLAGLFLSFLVQDTGFPAWIPALLVLPAIALMAWANVEMYRSGDEFERRKIAEAVMLAFVISTGLILAVGFLQYFLLPSVNWIFAFAILMFSWLVGTFVSSVRYR
ncbi:MAG: hypothetical protein ACTIJK_02285 [Brachybacterium sp.]